MIKAPGFGYISEMLTLHRQACYAHTVAIAFNREETAKQANEQIKILEHQILCDTTGVCLGEATPTKQTDD